MPVTHTPPTHGVAKLMLMLTVKGKPTMYALTYLHADPDVAKPPTWRLTKMSKHTEFYDVWQDTKGRWACTCGDWTFRRQNAPVSCKHVRALQAVNLLRGEL